MPIYEFKCLKCCEKFEEIVNSKDISICCPKCDSADTEKLVSSFSFKSSGGDIISSSTSKGCGTCAAKNCANCT